MAGNFPNLGKDLSIQVPKETQNKEIFSKTQNNKSVRSQRQRENLKNRKRKETCNLQGNPHKSNSGFFSRNIIGQERGGWHIKSAEI